MRCGRTSRAGETCLIADFLPAGGTSQLVQRAVATPGYAGPLFGPVPELAMSGVEQVVGGLRIVMEPSSPAPRRETRVAIPASPTPSTGLPATDLEPYLGAAGHLLVVNQDLTAAMHGHPEGVGTSGPMRDVCARLSRAGPLQDVGAVSAPGGVVTAPFVIDGAVET